MKPWPTCGLDELTTTHGDRYLPVRRARTRGRVGRLSRTIETIGILLSIAAMVAFAAFHDWFMVGVQGAARVTMMLIGFGLGFVLALALWLGIGSSR